MIDEPAESTGSRNQFSFDARVEGPNDARIVFSAVRWTGISQIVNQTIRMIISVILARLLSPEDFGMLAMASVVSGFFMVLQYFGAGGVVVQRKNITQRLVSSLFMLNIGLSTILFTALIAVAPLLASIYHSPQLVPIIRALGIGSVFTVVASIPTAILNRRLRFDQLALISFFGSLTQGIVAISLAALGFKVWALVYANIATSIVSVVTTWWLAGWRPQILFHWGDIKEVIDFCLHQAGTGFINYFVDDSDKFILGKWLGDRNLGFYTAAGRFCLYPSQTISPILNRVLFPAYARIQDDVAQLQKMILRSVGAITFITLPIVVGLMVMARPFILGVLGYKWAASIPIMIFLSPVGYMLSIHGPVNQLIMAMGRARWMFWLTITSGILTVLAFFAGLVWGVIGVVIAYSIVTIPLTWIRYRIAFKLINLPLASLVPALYRYVIGALIMGAAVFGSLMFLDSFDLRPILVTLICAPIGVLVYLVIMIIWHPPAVSDFYRILPTKMKETLGRLLLRVNINLEQ